MVTCLKNIVIN